MRSPRRILQVACCRATTRLSSSPNTRLTSVASASTSAIYDLPVLQPNNPIGSPGDRLAVRHDENRSAGLPVLLEQREDPLLRLAGDLACPRVRGHDTRTRG